MSETVREFLNKGPETVIKFKQFGGMDSQDPSEPLQKAQALNDAFATMNDSEKFIALWKIYSLWIRAAYVDDMVYYQDAWSIFGKNYWKVLDYQVYIRIGLGEDDDTSQLSVTYKHDGGSIGVLEPTLFTITGPKEIISLHQRILHEQMAQAQSAPFRN